METGREILHVKVLESPKVIGWTWEIASGPVHTKFGFSHILD